MKKSWKIFQLVQLLVFAGMTIFLLVRPVDGMGAVQTVEIRLLNVGIWAGYYLAALAVEWGIYALLHRNRR